MTASRPNNNGSAFLGRVRRSSAAEQPPIGGTPGAAAARVKGASACAGRSPGSVARRLGLPMARRVALAALLSWGLGSCLNAARAAEASAPAPATDFTAFKLIAERNIFDPNRSTRPSRRDREPVARPRPSETFALVGTLSSEKGAYAFFNGTSSEYRKVLRAEERIAGYRIAQVAPDHVALETDDGQRIKLGVGQQMRREGDDPWRLAGEAGSFESPAGPAVRPAPPADAPASAPSDGADDVLKRLLQRRQQELN